VTLDHLVGRLDHPRRTGRGWVARCPAHTDKHPSLSIAEGERGLLVYCWAGCTVAEICRALGLDVADLFFDKPGIPSRHPSRPEPRRPTPRECLEAAELELWRDAVARELRGLRTLDLARGFDCSEWSAADFDRAMAAVSRGYGDLTIADHLHVLAFGLREYLLKGAEDGERRSCAA
jgi:hypothetical protein